MNERLEADDPFAVLGLAPDATVADVRRARRQLATLHHPDRGGNERSMQRVNDAYERCIATIARRSTPPTGPDAPPTTAPQTAARASNEPGRPTPPPQSRYRAQPGEADRLRRREIERDDPSFVVDVPPAAAAAALAAIAATLGDVLDVDTPHRVDCRLEQPWPCWCVLELRPEPGERTSVSLTVVHDGSTGLDADMVRDLWVERLNRRGAPRP